MANFRMNRPRSWIILSVAVVIAGASWGAYAWRHAGDTRSTDSSLPAGLAQEDAGEKNAPVSLRATRPAPQTASERIDDEGVEDDVGHVDSGLSGVSRAVTANAPPSSAEPVEMTLLRAKETRSSPSVEVAKPPVAESVQAAKSALARGDLIEARRLLSAALTNGLSPSDEAYVYGELVRIADALLFSRVTNAQDPLVDVHEVAPGDSLYAIARQYKITEGLLASINAMDDPNRLRVGQRLKVLRGPFRAEISKTHHRMNVFLGDVLVRSYRVGLGTNGGTPTGAWIVNNKLTNPDWTDPITHQHYLADDPDNPIGERWIGLEGLAGEAVGKVGFGIHGTIDPESIGENMSMGCIRLLAEDVAEVYDLLVDRGSRVVIHP